LATGGELPGIDAERFVAMALPAGDPSDASVAILSMRALLKGDRTRGPVLQHLGARLNEAPCHALVDDALRELCEALEDHASVRAVEERLRTPAWKELAGHARLDALWSWIATARWTERRRGKAAAAAMKSVADEARPALELALDGLLPNTDDAVTALVERLAHVLDPDVWATTPPARRATLVAEILLLLERPELGDLAWPALVRRASGSGAFEPCTGKAAAVARTDLAVVCSDQDYHPDVLLRDVRFPQDVVLHLAACQRGSVAIHVAVQLERWLRHAARDAVKGKAGEAQARLLWRAFQRDPASSMFYELGRILRGSKTPLHALVDALYRLDVVRDEQGSAEEIASAYAEVARATTKLVIENDAGAPSARAIAEVADTIVTAASVDATTVGAPEWLRALDNVLVGREDKPWLGWGMLTESVVHAWRQLSAAMSAAHHAGAFITLAQCDTLEATLAVFDAEVPRLSWPETSILRRALGLVRERSVAWREQARERAEQQALVRELLDRGDERALAALVSAPEESAIDLLDADELRRLARFLLARLCYRDASRLRARVAGRVQLPGPLSHVAPLLVGVSSGTLLVLDIGTAWNEVVVAGRTTHYAATIGIALFFSFLALAGSVASRMPRTPETGALRRVAQVSVRVLPTYLGTFALACAVSAVVLLTLENTSIRPAGGVLFLPQTLLWGSLSLFLGLFLGLILQGRAAFRDD
jgi:hypothetical protein